jgi:phage gp46-like protein
MKDIAFLYDTDQRCFDLQCLGSEIQIEDSLRTAIALSLFTDAKVDEFELLRSETNRGFWADALDNHDTGSKLWLLLRSKSNSHIVKKTEEYCKKSLEWLIEDKLVENIEVKAHINNYELTINITIFYQNKTSNFKFEVS